MTTLAPGKNFIKRLQYGLMVGLLAIGGGVTGSAAPTIDNYETTALHQVEDLARRVRAFHDEAREILLQTVANPLFITYLTLEESGKNRYTADGTLQLSQRQSDLRKEIESLVMERHHTFPERQDLPLVVMAIKKLDASEKQ